jgi:hypothetical protein
VAPQPRAGEISRLVQVGSLKECNGGIDFTASELARAAGEHLGSGVRKKETPVDLEVCREPLEDRKEYFVLEPESKAERRILVELHISLRFPEIDLKDGVCKILHEYIVPTSFPAQLLIYI